MSAKRRLLCFMSILSLTGCQTADSKLVQEIEYGRDQPGLETLDDDLEMIREFEIFIDLESLDDPYKLHPLLNRYYLSPARLKPRTREGEGDDK